MKTLKYTTLLALIGLALSMPAMADIIYDQSALGDDAYGSDVARGIEFADDFTLGAGLNVITDIHWWGLYARDGSPQEFDDFTITIYEEASGLPSNPVFSQNVGHVTRTNTGINPFGFDVHAYSVDIAPLTLTANTSYWLSIVNDTTIDSDDEWFWMVNADNGFSAVNEGNDWETADVSLAFTLTNDNLNSAPVPEPTTMALLGLGLVGMAYRSRRQ